MKRKLLDLPLGTRFKSPWETLKPGEEPRVFVLLDRAGEGRIAGWDGSNAIPSRQAILSIGTREDMESLEVVVVD